VSETALAVVPGEVKLATKESASSLMQRASDVAGVCREIVIRTAMELQGKRYVKVEGWQSMATAFGCSPSIKEVSEDEQGNVIAIAELRRHDGTLLASAEGYCGTDEPRWANQPTYARRGMAQTRAISRVCRSVFAFVVVLIDANLSTTPAEEVPAAANDTPAAAPTATLAPAGVARKGSAVRDQSTRVRFGKAKGKYLCDISQDDLDFQHGAAQKAVQANDPKWHEANVRWLAAINAELEARS